MEMATQKSRWEKMKILRIQGKYSILNSGEEIPVVYIGATRKDKKFVYTFAGRRLFSDIIPAHR